MQMTRSEAAQRLTKFNEDKIRDGGYINTAIEMGIAALNEKVGSGLSWLQMLRSELGPLEQIARDHGWTHFENMPNLWIGPDGHTVAYLPEAIRKIIADAAAK